MSFNFVKPTCLEDLSFKGRRQSRKLCVEALYLYSFNCVSVSEILTFSWMLGSPIVNPHILSYVEYLFVGCVQNQEKFDKLIQSYAQKYEQSYILKVDQAILELGIFSLFYEQDVPSIVIINECINISKIYSGVEGHKFINAVLDAVYKNDIQKY